MLIVRYKIAINGEPLPLFLTSESIEILKEKLSEINETSKVEIEPIIS